MIELPHYNAIHELSIDLIDASESCDARREWAIYSQLEKLCSGETHPFPWETLADFTHDDQAALALYETALGHAANLGLDGFTASIELAIAERHRSLGQSVLAVEHARLADNAARGTDDLELRRAISEFLLECTSNDS